MSNLSENESPLEDKEDIWPHKIRMINNVPPKLININYVLSNIDHKDIKPELLQAMLECQTKGYEFIQFINVNKEA